MSTLPHSTVLLIASMITSGDVDAAARVYDGSPVAEASKPAIRSACARWGVDPARFGAPAKPAPGPETWAIRAHLTLDAIPQVAADGDFQLAMMQAAGRPTDGALLWRAEAIRARMGAPTTPLDVEAITRAAVALGEMFARRQARCTT
jgi:hypothetical protein